MSEEFIQMDTNFFNDHLNAKTSWNVFVYPKGGYYQFQPTDWSSVHLFIHSFHRYALSTCNTSDMYPDTGGTTVNKASETLPSWIFQVGVHTCEMCDWCYSQSCLSLLESGQSSLCSTQPKAPYTHVVSAYLLSTYCMPEP